ncbi:helix-turn-helix domain-containing protein [Faecalibacterium sp. CLA-AA-H254]|jgi:transcriptional regulator with XRE-family HTH domain|uniref:helix-turn-helix domain-containing protein n=1 Tax=Faecalibacterium hominis (ex Afrizal et al. 2022) TaxID=2881265 RepID=UPI001D0E1EDD|nr:helix-turn-helix domain-containing protein [Faecalibacterium hominis (ex Afrizal et al. 2022)]MCC2121764.1 helix-turn-helix domain-containing protein [Faecalibacterium hominis (ex Afrizal et al. 2022)]
MNPIEKDLRSYFGITSESNILEHYGTKRHSGRYPWGSGDNPYQHSGDFLSRVEELKKKGLSEKEILETINNSLPDEYKMGLTEFRTARQKAGHDRKALEYDQIRALKDDGLGWKEIGDKLGMSESSVRSKYNNAIGEKASQAEKIAATLKAEVDKKGMIDISEGANQVLGVSESKLDEAAYILEAEYGYQRYGVGIRQPTNARQQTNITVLAKPEFDQKYAYQHQDQIDSLGDYHSDDGGETFTKLQRPSSLDSNRVAIRYGDEGGLDKDGVMEIRRGVPDLDLGKSHYAQVRILVDGDHYLKGMAVYSDDLPDGVDVMFNTNKPSGTPKMKVLKEAKADPDNPFGAAIKANGQSMYIGDDGKEHLSPINKLKEEGDWDTMSRNVSSQFLSKQPKKLIENQLNLTVADYKAQYDEIMRYDNPTVKKKLLNDFADTVEGTSMTLKASAFPGQSTKVILPINKIKETEAYCPTYENGTRLALIRYPHAGTFEIPIVTVNNKNVSGKRNLGAIQDAIGINAKVAEQLSGADFDGDTVMVIPVTDKVNIKSTRALKALEGFDPKTAYAVPEGNPNNVRLMKKEEKQREMGVISNLITDMTLRGADEDELARAVKHSMVVIDAEKHKLDYKRSERENGIPELKQKWQIRVDEEGATHYGGASTLLSRRKQTVRVPERRGSIRVDKETGEYIYKESGRTFTDPKTGKERKAEDTVSLISETKDARTLSSGTIQENLYADFSNKLKAMANQARKEAVNMKGIQRNPEAAKTYAPEVASLKEKYNNMIANKPKERKAMLIANANIKAKIQEQGLDPTIDKKEIKKISSVEMQRARDSVGASGRKSKVTFTDREWEAVQAGAISDNMLTKFLNSSDSDEIVKRAMPKNVAVMTSAKMSKANAMLKSGYSYAEIAKACGVPESTVYSALNK